MMDLTFSTDAKAQNYALKRAILLYEDGTRGLATLHDIEDVDGRQTICAGVPVERTAFLDIAARLLGQESKGREIIEVPLLVVDSDLLCWYRPVMKRVTFWKTRSPELNALNGRNMWHPALLFIARPRELYVFALHSDARPTADTQLYQAPYFNVYGNAHLCEGNYRLPDSLRPDTVEEWERAFFDTSFSHTNLRTADLTLFNGGHDALWQHCALDTTKIFPVESLKSRNQTLGAVLRGEK